MNISGQFPIRNDWYKQGVDRENKLLLAAINTHSEDSVRFYIKNFAEQRENRRSLAKQKLNLSIETYEKTFETFEGTARYVEATVIFSFTKSKPRWELGKIDHEFSNGGKPVSLAPKWLYLTYPTAIFMQRGINITRILDRLKIDYYSLFEEPDQSLEDLLTKR